MRCFGQTTPVMATMQLVFWIITELLSGSKSHLSRTSKFWFDV